MPTSDMRMPQQWDIVVLPFPYADRLAEKRRPAVVVSRPWLAQAQGIVWVVMVTSAANAAWESDIGISDLDAAGLLNPSVIRPAKIATVDLSRVVRIAGRLTTRDTEILKERLATALGF